MSGEPINPPESSPEPVLGDPLSELTERDVFLLLDHFESSDLTSLHVKAGAFEVRLSRRAERDPETEAWRPPSAERATQRTDGPPPNEAAPVVKRREGPDLAAAEGVENPDSSEASTGPSRCVAITAPTLGAFYQAARPDLPAYVSVGSRVEPGMTVGLIEAMKVFTAVNAGVQGVIKEVLVANNDFVEYGQALFVVDSDAADGEMAAQ